MNTRKKSRIDALLDRAVFLRKEANRCEAQAVAEALTPPRTKYTLTVYKDTPGTAPQSVVEAELAKRIGDNATVIVTGYEEL